MRKLLVVRRKGKLKVKSKSVLQLQLEPSTGSAPVIREYPLRDLDGVLVIGRNILVEAGAISVLSSKNIPIAVIAKKSVGILFNPIITVSPHYRKLQYLLPETRKLEIALEYIRSKIMGLRNILVYHNINPPKIPPAPEPSGIPAQLEDKIRIWESDTSRMLWRKLQETLDPDILQTLRERYGFKGRKPRHPDPLNKAISIMYSALYTLSTKALLAAGLDPTYGFLHKTRYSTPLTFDYTEQFKPIAVQAAITLINKYGLPELDEDGELKKKHITQAMKELYKLLTLKHQNTKRTPYQQIYLKARCLARHLAGRCRKQQLTITWNRAAYRTHKKI